MRRLVRIPPLEFPAGAGRNTRKSWIVSIDDATTTLPDTLSPETLKEKRTRFQSRYEKELTNAEAVALEWKKFSSPKKKREVFECMLIPKQLYIAASHANPFHRHKEEIFHIAHNQTQNATIATSIIVANPWANARVVARGKNIPEESARPQTADVRQNLG